MDIFGFFDQNTAAGDEAKQFLNSVFVHNPLLDAGREVGVDANGFQPGFVAAYVEQDHQRSNPGGFPWAFSGPARQGANYQRSLAAPLLAVQAEKHLKLFGGLGGNYRVAWNRSRAAELDSRSSKHAGLGSRSTSG